MVLQLEKWKEQKKSLKLTFDDLAELTNISRRQLQYLFNGEIDNPRIDTVHAIERALGLTPEPTEEEKALGLTRTAPIALADKDRRRLTMLMEADDVLGEKTVDSMLKMIELAVESKKNS